MPDPSVTVRRWTRFGHDRLYMTDTGGEPLGWADVETGLVHATSDDCLPAISQALTAWRADTRQHSDPVPPFTTARSTPVPSTFYGPVSVPPAAQVAVQPAMAPAVRPPVMADPSPPPLEPWWDLAPNRAGAAAREQADLLRAAAPVRTFLGRLVGRRTPERDWRIGADGEELVAAQLVRLVQSDTRWRVLHAVRVGINGSDIDHVVMGPGGVFTLNTKHHPRASVWVGGDTFLVNGHRCSYVRNSRHEAARASRLLTAASGLRVGVQGVIVPVGARSVTIKTAPDRVFVVPRRGIAAWLLGRGRVLDDHAVSVISEAARRSTTWQPSSP